MAVSNRPTQDVNDIRLVSAWRPAGSQTILWAQDMKTGDLLHLVQWGNRIYLPVTTGLRLGIGVYNGSSGWKAYPMYVEGKNLYDNGPSRPDDCTSDDMWEAPAGSSLVMDALKNRDHRTGRALVIVSNGLGLGIGEATYGTDAFRGQIRVYERSALSYVAPRPMRSFDSDHFGARGGLESFGNQTYGAATRSMGGLDTFGSKGVDVSRGVPALGTDHQVGIGAGAEERRESRRTGVHYRRDSSLVAALCVESRADLAEVLGAAQHAGYQWYWTPSGPQWFTTWAPPAMPVSPHIPVAPEPHRPEGNNWGWGV